MTAAQIAQSEVFHAYVAPNLWIAYVMFGIGIAGLAYVASFTDKDDKSITDLQKEAV